METSLQFIQPLSFAQLLKCTTHFSSVDFPNSTTVYEFNYPDDSICNFIPTGCNEWLLGYNANSDKTNDYIVYKIGPVSELTSIALDPFDTYIAIRFTPTVYYAVNGDEEDTPCNAFNNIQVIKPDPDSNISKLVTKVKNAKSFEDRVACLKNHINNYKHLYAFPPAVLQMINSIIEAKGNILVSELATQLCYSERHVNRLFLDAMGYGPKDFCKYIRFQFALNEIMSNPARNNFEFILNTGYSDQAHFQREFKFFTGMTPKDYTRLIK